MVHLLKMITALSNEQPSPTPAPAQAHEVTIGTLGYADDTYTLGKTMQSLQLPLDATEERQW